MSCVSVEELELLSFFEVEPSLADPDAPWPYNDFTYLLTPGRYVVCFRIAPAYGDLSLSVAHGGIDIYHFVGMSVKDVRYHQDADGDALQIIVSDHDRIWLRLRPNVLIVQDAGEA